MQQIYFGGDFNADKLSANDVLPSFCCDNVLVWLDHDPTTRSHTFHNDTVGRYSLIDHFMCSVDLVSPISNVKILTDDNNLSDHYAIIYGFASNICEASSDSKQCDVGARLDWQRADIGRYQSVLTSLLSNIALPVDALLCGDTLCDIHSDSLDNYYNSIVECLLAASKCSVPAVKVGVQKHWWTPELDKLKDDCIDICQLWKGLGCPRNGVINAERLRRKYRYKLAIKDAAAEADKSFSDNLFNSLCGKNHIEFWKSWRRKFSVHNSKPASCVNGQSGDANIVKEFTKFFEQTGRSNTAEADLVFCKEVEQRLSSSPALFVVPPRITWCDMQECISQLKAGKAISFDGVYNEHIIYGADCLNVHLCLLFNALVSHGIVPSAFCIGVIIPLLKNKHGDASKLEMYRGITIAPAASKLFELLLFRL